MDWFPYYRDLHRERFKDKQEQCPRQFEDVVMDIQQVNYIVKFYLGLPTFPTKLLNDHDLDTCFSKFTFLDKWHVINNFLQEHVRKKVIAIVSTRFFLDIKIKSIS